MFYDGIVAEHSLDKYKMESGRGYRYLRATANAEANVSAQQQPSTAAYIRDNLDGTNADRFNAFEADLLSLDFSTDEVDAIRNFLAAIILLGNVRYTDEGKFAAVENSDLVNCVGKLLGVDEKKFQWSLENYCLIKAGTAERRKHTADEARDARDVLASTIYGRLVDWIVNKINQKLAFGRAVL